MSVSPFRSTVKSLKNPSLQEDPGADAYVMSSQVNPPLMVRISKRAIDVCGATIFFVLFGWLYIFLWCAVVLTSSGPGIYSQPRFGKSGKVFKFYKFRSMLPNSEALLQQHLAENESARMEWSEFQKLDKDPRITSFGRFIRKASLDELPQFWNVLIGDMSLIGPRPCMMNQKTLYDDKWIYYCAVRPGITGLWQVSGRNQLSYARRVELDVDYVRNLSVISDIKIAFKTVSVVLTGHGSR